MIEPGPVGAVELAAAQRSLIAAPLRLAVLGALDARAALLGRALRMLGGGEVHAFPVVGELAAAIDGLRALGFHGAWLAEPHGPDALAHCDLIDPHARALARVDVLRFEGEVTRGELLSSRALRALLERARPQGARVLGAGWRARAAQLALEELSVPRRDEGLAIVAGELDEVLPDDAPVLDLRSSLELEVRLAVELLSPWHARAEAIERRLLAVARATHR